MEGEIGEGKAVDNLRSVPPEATVLEKDLRTGIVRRLTNHGIQKRQTAKWAATLARGSE